MLSSIFKLFYFLGLEKIVGFLCWLVAFEKFVVVVVDNYPQSRRIYPTHFSGSLFVMVLDAVISVFGGEMRGEAGEMGSLV